MTSRPKLHRSTPTIPALLVAGVNLTCGSTVLAPAEWLQTVDLIAFSTFAGTASCAPSRFALCFASSPRTRPEGGNPVSRAEAPPRTTVADPTGAPPAPERRGLAPVVTDSSAAVAGEDDHPAARRDAPGPWSWSQGLGTFQPQADGPRSDLPPMAFVPLPRYDPPAEAQRDGAHGGGDGPIFGTSDTPPPSLPPGTGCGAAGCDDPATWVLPPNPTAVGDAPAAAVAEPNTVVLLGVAVAALAWIRRRRRPSRGH